MRKLKILRLILMGLVGASVLFATEVPTNLSTAKAAVVRFADSGDYAKALAVTGAEASNWIAARASRSMDGEKPALILDIDETALTNLPHMREMDFGYLPKLWDEWVEEGTAPRIEPIFEVYQTARRHGVTVFFITGRKESDRPGTVRNLRDAGYTEYERLICKPRGFKGTSGDYKTAARKQLEAEGWTIIANVGDQQSDLSGGHSEKVFKLANPFYLID